MSPFHGITTYGHPLLDEVGHILLHHFHTLDLMKSIIKFLDPCACCDLIGAMEGMNNLPQS